MAPTSVTCTAFRSAVSFCPCASVWEHVLHHSQKLRSQVGNALDLGFQLSPAISVGETASFAPRTLFLQKVVRHGVWMSKDRAQIYGCIITQIITVHIYSGTETAQCPQAVGHRAQTETSPQAPQALDSKDPLSFYAGQSNRNKITDNSN